MEDTLDLRVLRLEKEMSTSPGHRKGVQMMASSVSNSVTQAMFLFIMVIPSDITAHQAREVEEVESNIGTASRPMRSLRIPSSVSSLTKVHLHSLIHPSHLQSKI